MRERWPWATSNITIGPLKRTEKRSYFETMFTYLQNTQIRSRLDNSCKIVLGSKTILSSFIFNARLTNFSSAEKKPRISCTSLQHFAISVTSLLLSPRLHHTLVTCGQHLRISWQCPGIISVRILGSTTPWKPFLIAVVISLCAWKTWRVCKFWSEDKKVANFWGMTVLW